MCRVSSSLVRSALWATFLHGLVGIFVGTRAREAKSSAEHAWAGRAVAREKTAKCTASATERNRARRSQNAGGDIS
eukprot:8266436-Pyramimonas_sp.AAC.1